MEVLGVSKVEIENDLSGIKVDGVILVKDGKLIFNVSSEGSEISIHKQDNNFAVRKVKISFENNPPMEAY